MRHGCALLSSAVAFAIAAVFPAAAQQQPQTPPYMSVIVGGERPSAAETASQNVLALNTAMFSLYGDSGAVFGKNILAQHPVILALF